MWCLVSLIYQLGSVDGSDWSGVKLKARVLEFLCLRSSSLRLLQWASHSPSDNEACFFVLSYYSLTIITHETTTIGRGNKQRLLRDLSGIRFISSYYLYHCPRQPWQDKSDNPDALFSVWITAGRGFERFRNLEKPGGPSYLRVSKHIHSTISQRRLGPNLGNGLVQPHEKHFLSTLIEKFGI